ncbi:glycerophosphodiester phosphodiesterase family protein [Aliiroseovarius sp. F20344]|uniref:glycerophosphodiester phosphodiesterase family protein n=1 Tax=Aliiroseovarius sp. F20344 TaxID=2926414 RepID=UPI001FF6A7EB|nr:glycerophosphodiester phosphodiesterase family protein [Aliiroseovarius sp. F20344]MCK0142125.1 glycerophosphodiester phosphodiesterase family protein [Aliiroseovarius sp. F20344]
MNERTILAIVTLVACLNLSAAYAQMNVDERFARSQPDVVMAHRSAVIGEAPENSLAWLQGAIDRGIDMVHINPQLTADDSYILMHDLTLNRMTDVERVFPDGPPNGPSREQRGGKDFVRDYTIDQVKQLRLVTSEDSAPHRIPTLQEALDLVDGQVIVVLGLKNYEIDSLTQALAGRQTRNVLLWGLYFSGTDQSKLRGIAAATGIDVAIVLFRSRNYLADLEKIYLQIGERIRMVSVGSAGLTPEFLARMEELDIRLMISGFAGPEDNALVNRNDPAKWNAALELGFAASTDRPDLLLEALGR